MTQRLDTGTRITGDEFGPIYAGGEQKRMRGAACYPNEQIDCYVLQRIATWEHGESRGWDRERVDRVSMRTAVRGGRQDESYPLRWSAMHD